MIQVRKSEHRGMADHGWLLAKHTFSFADYYDPKNMGFRSLRVINEDRIGGEEGFGTHPHRDMEIITFIIEGALQHKDSMGNGAVIRPGEIQYMSAGTGVTHSEFNPGKEETHLLQIWIMPNKKGVQPRYGELKYSNKNIEGKLTQLVVPEGQKGLTDDVIHIHQDVVIWLGKLSANEMGQIPIQAGRGAWIQMVSGSLDVNGTSIRAGDGCAVEDETDLLMKALSDNTEFLVFDLN